MQINQRYIITGRLGAGAMGTVYRAVDTLTEVEYAVKVVSEGLQGDAGALKQLQREFAIAQQLTHPQLLRINHFDSSAEHSYVLMEYIDGENLEEFRTLQGGKLSEEQVRRFLAELVAPLDFLHDKGIVHLDLKPQNLMYARGRTGNELKITDFGISRSLKEQIGRLSSNFDLQGTLCYMSPEQLRNEECDRRTDMYALGIILYHLLTGEFPFPLNKRSIISWHIGPEAQLEKLQRPWRTVVEKCLRRDASQRYSSCKDVLEDLTSLLRSEENVQRAVRQRDTAARSLPDQVHTRYDVSSDTVTIEELFVDPGAYAGQTIRVRGRYRLLHANTSSFTVTDGALELFVKYGELPQEQKAMVLREQAKGRSVVIEGTVIVRGKPEIAASRVSIEGLQASPPRQSADGTVTLEEIFVDPDAYAGRKIRLRGSYRLLFAGTGSFTVTDGAFEIFVKYGELPPEQKAMVLREQAKGRSVVIEGTVIVRGKPEIAASSVSIEGLQASPPRQSADGTVTIEELFVDPDAYAGQKIRLRGSYRLLFASTGSFTVTDGALEIFVKYGELPRDQKAIVLREQAKGRSVVIEGTVTVRGKPEIAASSVSIEGLQASPPRQSDDGTVTIEELFVDPDAYAGQKIRLRGSYRLLFASSGSFTVTDGALEIFVKYGELPPDQKAMVLREQAKGQPMTIEGTFTRDRLKVTASRISFD